jgi:hypothetical protein
MRLIYCAVNRGGYGQSITGEGSIQPSRLFIFAKRSRKTVTTTAKLSAAGDRTANNDNRYKPLHEPLQNHYRLKTAKYRAL